LKNIQYTKICIDLIFKQTFYPFNVYTQTLTPKMYFLTTIIQINILDFKQHVEKFKQD